MTHLFLTGEKRVGKSTLIQSLIAEKNDELGGFRTIRRYDARVQAHTVHLVHAGHDECLSSENQLFICGQADAGVAERFDTLGVAALSEATGAELILMDELGTHEARAGGFRAAVLKLLDGSTPIVGVIQQSALDLWSALVTHPSVKLVTVTKENRDALVHELSALLNGDKDAVASPAKQEMDEASLLTALTARDNTKAFALYQRIREEYQSVPGASCGASAGEGFTRFMVQNMHEIRKEGLTMQEKRYSCRCGEIHYWVNEIDNCRPSLIFLPGLTADHRLFDKQVEAFCGAYNVLVWDAPAHAASWPFTFDFTLMDKARWLHEILGAEGIAQPILVGQSMGGYVGQCYAELFPGKLAGFIAIDSAPLQRRYTSAWELWLLKRMESVYRLYPWKALLKSGSDGVAVTAYGRELMRSMMQVYADDKVRYAKLSGHGLFMLAEAMEADRAYRLDCPVLLICGEKDRAGSCIRYNRVWSRDAGHRLEWIENAGHNANTDRPERVNDLIADFVQMVEAGC